VSEHEERIKDSYHIIADVMLAVMQAVRKMKYWPPVENGGLSGS